MIFKENLASHYDDKYFFWQKDFGDFGGWVNKPKFEKYITPKSEVLDFGCGGRLFIKQIELCKKGRGRAKSNCAKNSTRE